MKTTPLRRAYGQLDRDQVVAALQTLARRVGVGGVTMRELATELGAAAPSVYYHVPNKQTALNLLAEAVLADIPEPGPGTWEARLDELYCAAREVILDVPGIAALLQTNGYGERARGLDRLSRTLVAEAGLTGAEVGTAHTVLFTYLLGSVSLEESRPDAARGGKRQRDKRFRAGLNVIIAGVRSMGGHR